jgi:hypothetical protein
VKKFATEIIGDNLIMLDKRADGNYDQGQPGGTSTDDGDIERLPF